MFKKVAEGRYIVDEESTNKLMQDVDTFYEVIVDIKNKWNKAVDNELYMTILSRHISDMFISERKEDLKNNDYITIDFSLGNKRYVATLGMLENEYINGIKLIA